MLIFNMFVVPKEAVIHYKYLDLFNKNNFIYKRLRD